MKRLLATAICAATIGTAALGGCSSSQSSDTAAGTSDVTSTPTERPAATPQGTDTAALTSDVTVPAWAEHTDILDAYKLLHRLGFRVGLTQQMSVSSLIVPGVTLAPTAGTRLPRGSIVQITPAFAAIGSPAVLKSDPHYRVPSFVGQALNEAVRWANRHDMFWSIPRLPALPASAAPHLFDAYRIVGQQPTPNSTIVQGVMVGHGFKPTPITLTVVPKTEP